MFLSMIPVVAVQCMQCKHLLPFPEGAIIPVCVAFPDGIPRKISERKYDHRNPFPGDHGIRFEAREGITPKFVFIKDS